MHFLNFATIFSYDLSDFKSMIVLKCKKYRFIPSVKSCNSVKKILSELKKGRVS